MKKKNIQEDKKILWFFLIFLGNIIAMIIYWYLFIWSEPDKNKEYIVRKTKN